MGAISDSILAAVDDGACDTTAIEEATGLERSQIYTGVHALKQSGALIKGPTGLTRGDGAAPKRNVQRTDTEVDSHRTAPPPAARTKKTRRKAKVKRTKVAARVAKKPRAVAPSTASEPIAFARFGEFVVIRREDLAQLLATLERWLVIVQKSA